MQADGRVTTYQPGVTALTAESEGKSSTVALTVRAVPVAAVVMSALPHPLETGEMVSLTAMVTDASGRVLNGRTITWSTSDAAIATIAPSGQITPRSPGEVTLTAASEGKSASITTSVDAPPSAILLYQRSTPLVNELFTLGLRPGDVPLKLNAGSVSQQPTVSADGARVAFYVSMVTSRALTRLGRRTASGSRSRRAAAPPAPGVGRSGSCVPTGRRSAS